jgi:hypothetical protein
MCGTWNSGAISSSCSTEPPRQLSQADGCGHRIPIPRVPVAKRFHGLVEGCSSNHRVRLPRHCHPPKPSFISLSLSSHDRTGKYRIIERPSLVCQLGSDFSLFASSSLPSFFCRFRHLMVFSVLTGGSVWWGFQHAQSKGLRGWSLRFLKLAPNKIFGAMIEKFFSGLRPGPARKQQLHHAPASKEGENCKGKGIFSEEAWRFVVWTLWFAGILDSCDQFALPWELSLSLPHIQKL